MENRRKKYQKENTACTEATTQGRSWHVGRNQKSIMAGYDKREEYQKAMRF